MSNFTTENIGAFELNGAVVLSSDAALEAIVAGPPTLPTANCRVPTGGNPFGCIGQDDGALEGLAGTLSATPSNPAMCGPIPPTIHPAVCGRIDDGALEAAAVATSGPTIQYCNTMVGANCPRRIDDGVN